MVQFSTWGLLIKEQQLNYYNWMHLVVILWPDEEFQPHCSQSQPWWHHLFWSVNLDVWWSKYHREGPILISVIAETDSVVHGFVFKALTPLFSTFRQPITVFFFIAESLVTKNLTGLYYNQGHAHHWGRWGPACCICFREFGHFGSLEVVYKNIW